MNLHLSPGSESIINQVSQIVSPAYLVGGSVRNSLLGLPAKDYDFTSPLRPDEIETAIREAGKRPYLIGKRFGTVAFKLDGHMIEVTTFRTETYTPGSRKPTVSFVDDITYDLSRRDFTINAMAARPDGTVIDPFDGQADLNAKLIRTVNKPYERFNEDPLRMLRAARFSSQLGFTIEPNTEHYATKKSSHILTISHERWIQELDKLLTGQFVESGLQFLARTRLLNYMIPELSIQVGLNQDSPYHELDLWNHTVKTVRLTEPDLDWRWTALLHDIGKPYSRQKNKRGYSNYVDHAEIGAELVSKIGPYLRWPKSRTEAVRQLVADHLESDSPIFKADSAARFAD